MKKIIDIFDKESYIKTMKISINNQILVFQKLVNSNKKLGYPTDIYEGIITDCIDINSKLNDKIYELKDNDIKVLKKCLSSSINRLKKHISLNKELGYPIDLYEQLLLECIDIYGKLDK